SMMSNPIVLRLVLFLRLPSNAGSNALHLLLVPIRDPFPLFQQRRKAFRYGLLHLGNTRLENAAQRFLEALQKSFLLRIDLLCQFGALLYGGALEFFVVSSQLLLCSALNFVDERRGRFVG